MTRIYSNKDLNKIIKSENWKEDYYTRTNLVISIIFTVLCFIGLILLIIYH
jgi:hypothetical protein